MGLDNIIYERRAVSNKELGEALAPLVGGMLTEDTNSFRGKVYSDLNEAITSYDLYGCDDWTTDTLSTVVNAYEEIILENKVDEWLSTYNNSNGNVWGIDYSKDEFMALYKVFKLCRDNYWQINSWF